MDRKSQFEHEISVKDILARHKSALADILNSQFGVADATMESFFNTVPMLFCIADMDGYLVTFNDRWEKELGYAQEELRTTKFIEFVHPDDRERTNEMYSDIMAGKECINWKNRYKKKFGGWVNIHWFCRLTRNNKFIMCTAFTDDER